MPTGSVAGNYDDHQEESDSDNDNDGEASDGCNNGSSDMQEPDLLGDEDTMFIEVPWQGLDLSAEEQLQSLQCGKNEASKFSLLLLLCRLFLLITSLLKCTPQPRPCWPLLQWG